MGDSAFHKLQDNKLLTVTITEVMDIQEPISKLRSLLEGRLGVDLSSFIICLQDNVEVSLILFLNAGIFYSKHFYIK